MRHTTCTVRFVLTPLLSLGLVSLFCLTLSAQTLPKHITKSSSSTLWWITQTGLGSAGEFEINNASNSKPALYATTNGTGPALYVVTSGSGDGIEGFTSSGTISGNGVYGHGFNSGNGGYFVAQTSGNGVYGQSSTGNGVAGASSNGYGVYGHNLNSNNDGVVGGATFGVEGSGSGNADGGHFSANGTGNGVYAESASGYAGYFNGNTYVNGTVYYNALQQNSDARYKQNIRTLPNALDTILALRGVSFVWRQNEFPQMKFGKTRQVGFIAQEVEKVAPELVSKDSKGMRSVAYTEVIPILLEAIKLQQQQIETLKAQKDRKSVV